MMTGKLPDQYDHGWSSLVVGEEPIGPIVKHVWNVAMNLMEFFWSLS